MRIAACDHPETVGQTDRGKQCARRGFRLVGADGQDMSHLCQPIERDIMSTNIGDCGLLWS